ncbi:SIMPL domain-containing protein [Robertkochia solimangrovi]|uniref:SIMPL domain-containing protein n=1 Tax=Robertkochia solimangrovi TaxID=2213046 RepID=UPI00117E99E3|nr:SIMPL domain-containing protein [Robertkochia solimangrovi]TRZ46164.1 SIMPL domain-containing protein [Robertkochia solimangrovi]
MKKTIITLALILQVSFMLAKPFQEKNFIDENYIEVTGTSEMEIIPDEIFLKVIIDEEERKGKQSLQESERYLVNVLQNLEIDVDEALSIKDINSNFKNYWIGKSDVFTQKEYEIEVKDAATAGEIIKALSENNISNCTVSRISHSEIEKFREEVKIEAIKAAKNKAEKLTSAIGQKTGKAIFIRENGDTNVYEGNMMGISNAITIRGNAAIYGSRASQPLIEFGKIKMEYKILVRFKLEDL